MIELLISIGVGSVVITMLMSILSTTLLTKNMADHENRLLNESYYISEYVQARVFDLGVRSIEDLSPEDGDDQILRMNHEYDIVQSSESGVIYRDYENAESFILHYDSSQSSLHYGSAGQFDYTNNVFADPEGTRINSQNVNVDNVTTLSFTCIAEAEFQDDEVKCASAIIEINVTLNFMINENPLFKPMRFESTIVF